MKRASFLLMLLLPLSVFSQMMDAVAFMDKVVARLKNDAAVEMSYSYKAYDGVEQLASDEGVMILDGERYVLLMEDMKVWCDGKSQWSYMDVSEEVYVTYADSEEAQNLSPLYIMESCRNGYDSSVSFDGDMATVTLVTQDLEAVVERVEFVAEAKSSLLRTMKIFLSGQGYIAVELKGYKAKCKFDNTVFEFPAKEYQSAVVVDMR